MKKLCEYFGGAGRRKWEARIMAALLNEPLSAEELAVLRRKLEQDPRLRAFAWESGEHLSLISEAMGNPEAGDLHPLLANLERSPCANSKKLRQATTGGWSGWWPEICGAAACLVLLGGLYPLFNQKWMDHMEASVYQAPVVPVRIEETVVLEQVAKTKVGSDQVQAGVNYFMTPDSSELRDRDAVVAGSAREGFTKSAPGRERSARMARGEPLGLSQSGGRLPMAKPPSANVSSARTRSVAAPVSESVPVSKVAPSSVGARGVSHASREVLQRSVAQESNWTSPVPSSPAPLSPALPSSPLDVQVTADRSQPVAFEQLATRANLGEKEDRRLSLKASPQEQRQAPQMLSVGEHPFSTFSLNVSDVSFQLALAQLRRGELPAGDQVRPEEFYNYFEYADPAPVAGQPVAFFAENAQVPFLHGQQLVRFAVKTAGEGREAGRPLNLTLLIDHSGSMVRADRQLILDRLLGEMQKILNPGDRVNVVTFSTSTSVLGMDLAPTQLPGIQQQLRQMSPQGGTNLELALETGYAVARQHKRAEAINRMILITDGAANLGNTSPELLAEQIQQGKLQGVFFDVIGAGWDEYHDALLERLTRNGDGRYRFVNSGEEVPPLLRSLAGAFRPAAQDVKVQVEWNPRQVVRYRLIGYETHRLRDEDFRDDRVDAAELAANETGNALYLIERAAEAEGPLGTVRIRYRPANGGAVRELAWVLPSNVPQDLYEAPASLQLAAAAAFFAEKFSNPGGTAGIRFQDLMQLLEQPRRFYPDPTRIRELSEMIQQAMRLE